MNHFLIRKHPVGSNRTFVEASRSRRVGGCALAMSMFLALLLLGCAFGAEWPNSPSWQPAQVWSNQMWSKVDYDPKLADLFFETEEWGYTDDDLLPPEERPKERTRVMHTAKCFSTSFGVEHLVRFCKARKAGADTIQLII
jgi:hypothetical protein